MHLNSVLHIILLQLLQLLACVINGFWAKGSSFNFAGYIDLISNVREKKINKYVISCTYMYVEKRSQGQSRILQLGQLID